MKAVPTTQSLIEAQKVLVYQRGRGNWVVIRPERTKPERVFKTQDEAMNFAEHYQGKGMNVIVFNDNASIRQVFFADGKVLHAD